MKQLTTFKKKNNVKEILKKIWNHVSYFLILRDGI